MNVVARLALCFSAFLVFASKSGSQDYIWPTDASHAMTSSFAEYRPGRFHAGLDIKTWGTTGYKIFAVRPGYVSRIAVSPYGYGRAVYFSLDTGETIIYGHLERFNEDIERYVRNEQEKRERFSLQLYPMASEFVYQQGEVLGFTGQSGVGYPHLHFEMRDPANRPINPFLKGYRVQDTVPPAITKISAAPLDAFSKVNGDWKPVVLTPLLVRTGEYHLAAPLLVEGRIGFSLSVYDRMDDITNRFGIYENRLLLDDKLVFSAQYNSFSYEVNNQANLDRDFRLYMRGQGLFYKLYRDEGNTLSHYPDGAPYYGVIDFTSAIDRSSPFFAGPKIPARLEMAEGVVPIHRGRHILRLETMDFWGNKSVCLGEIIAGDDSLHSTVAAMNSQDYGSSFAFSNSSGNYTPDSLSFELSGDFYDLYARLEITASRGIDVPPRVTGWRTVTLAESLNIVRLNSRTFIGAWPLDDEAGPVRFDIIFRDRGGEVRTIEKWLPYRTEKKGVHSRYYTQDQNCRISFSGNSLFRDIYMRSEPVVEPGDLYRLGSAVYEIEPQDVPLNGGAEVTIKYAATDSLPQKLGLYYQSNGTWRFFGNRIDLLQKTISGHVTSFGTFCLIRDMEPPLIYALWPSDGATLVDRQPKLSTRFEDKLSGISGEENMVLKLDGKKMVAEYDPENKILFCTPSTPLNTGPHRLEFVATDRSGNTSRKSHTFFIQ
ncbi:hypothetical protein A2V82_16875 [candidate division KSB1 bacterium RBG_16_48_16]|nr:MAG: hypothetical protein A2V82_16875 [candidate division KSB1 bacterium RBG_16_48_16]